MPLVASDLEYLRTSIAKRSGNVISDGQGYLLEARLKPLVDEKGLTDLHSLVEELRKKPQDPLHDRITEMMTINETSFFRDMQPFHAVRDFVLPELIEKRKGVRSLSIWSAASSSGQEAYSLAILLRENFPDLNTWNVRVQGTDISEAMVKRTTEGIYSQFEVNRGLPAPMLIKYFQRSGLKWAVKPEVKKLVQCKRMNLTESWPAITKHDIVFLRNVLIYFDQQTKLQILSRVHNSMKPDGYLFLGGGETLINMDVKFERVTLGGTCCLRPIKE